MAKQISQGPLTEAVFYILISLYKPLHGYGIMQNVTELSSNRVELGPGTLYGAINTLLEREWIEPVSNEKSSRKKIYQITKLGKSIVLDEMERLKELVNNGLKVMEGVV